MYTKIQFQSTFICLYLCPLIKRICIFGSERYMKSGKPKRSCMGLGVVDGSPPTGAAFFILKKPHHICDKYSTAYLSFCFNKF